MSAQRKLFSTLPLMRVRLAIIARPVVYRPVSRSIVTTSTLFRPNAAENVLETSKDESVPVPSEQITEEAKKAEPDAAEQVENMEKKGMDTLPTQT